jgi:hypothetical protein
MITGNLMACLSSPKVTSSSDHQIWLMHGEVVSVKISGGRGGCNTSSYSMLLMRPGDTSAPHSNGAHHVDIETSKVVRLSRSGESRRMELTSRHETLPTTVRACRLNPLGQPSWDRMITCSAGGMRVAPPSHWCCIVRTDISYHRGSTSSLCKYLE